MPIFDSNATNSDDQLLVIDRLDDGGIDTVITVTAGTPVEVKVGGSPKDERKIVIIQPDGKIKFGFSNTTQSFNMQKNQMMSLSLGPNTSLWIDAVAGSVDVAIGEAG